ncbi:MAG: outer membrane beta-barrel protein [Verrucomicrobia bacterium]|nr:outer membrane beta-barrel protein [Prolixibacteraceae bacterium]
MKQITLLVVLTIFTLNSWGQAHIRLSFTTSPTINWMNSSNRDVDKQPLVLGYDFGINGDIYFTENDNYSFQTGLNIINSGGKLGFRANQGFAFAGEELEENVEIRYRLRYMEVPLNIRLRTEEFQRVYYWGLFGLSPMVNIGARGDSDDGALRKATIHDEINMFNIGMNVGVGFDYDLGGNNSVSAGLIFQNGLTDVTTDNAFTDKTVLNSLKVRLALLF